MSSRRCKRHAADVSSASGVCASCLRERLLAVVAAQARRQQQSPPDRRLNFPLSVSPYVSRRKSEASAARQQLNGDGNGRVHHRRFYSTPQVGPTGSVTAMEVGEKRSEKKTKMSSLFSGIFRSSSWLSSVFSTRREKRGSTTAFPLEEGSAAPRRPTRVITVNRGLSPARCSSDEEEEAGDGSSGGSSDSSWRRRRETTPSHASATRRRTASAASNGRNPSSGFAFCLSPLVRASPSHRNRSSEPAASGECRVHRLSKPASFCKNRSRKLADFGRYNSKCGRSHR